jgi:hypothetical protein
LSETAIENLDAVDDLYGYCTMRWEIVVALVREIEKAHNIGE